MARKAQLLVTVGRGGVRSVGIFKAKLRKVIKGTDYPFVQEKMYLSYDNKKERWFRTPVEAPSNPGRKCVGLGCFIRANVK